MSGVLIGLLSAYLIGSIPTAYLLVKWTRRVDVRAIGSGNVGATNATRAAGLSVGLLVFLIDMAKGLVATSVLAPTFVNPSSQTVRLTYGLAAVIGHTFPIFLKFRGGKGVATTMGVLFGAGPVIAGTCLAVWIVCFVLWRYVSVGSIAAAITLPLAQLLTRRPLSEALLGTALAILVIARHRVNIERLVQGQEHRMGRKI